MPHIHSQQKPGAPTFTAKPASPSLFGLDEFATPIDTDIMDREWYHGQDYYPHSALHATSRLSPVDDGLTAVAFNYPAHTEPGSEALTGMSTSSLFPCSFFPSNAIAHHSMRASSVGRSSRLCFVQPGCHRVISLVYAQSHVTAISKMPRLNTSPTMEFPLPHDLQTCA